MGNRQPVKRKDSFPYNYTLVEQFSFPIEECDDNRIDYRKKIERVNKDEIIQTEIKNGIIIKEKYIRNTSLILKKATKTEEEVPNKIEKKEIYIHYINKKFPINISIYNSIEQLKNDIQNILNLKNINNNQITLFFKKINLIGNIEIKNDKDVENLKNENEGNIFVNITNSQNKQEINLIMEKTEFEKEINEGEQIKNNILNDKKYNQEKLIDSKKVLKSNYLYLKKINKIDIEENNKVSKEEVIKKEQESILSLLSKVLESKGVETAVYKDNKINTSNEFIQKICSGFSDKKKYTFQFDFGDKKNDEIINDNNKFNDFAEEYKKTIAKKFNMDPNNIIITNPRKGSLKVDVIFKNSDVFSDNNIKAKFNDCQEIVNIKRDVLMQGCQLDNSIFDERYNNKDGGWGINEYRGGEKYIPPLGWTGYGLKVSGKYDNGNDDWLGHLNQDNEYAIAYYPIKDFLQNSEDMKKLINSIAKTQNNNLNNDEIFANNININPKSNKKYHLCGTGIFVFQDIAIADANSSEVNIGGVKYKIVFMCRVKPDEIRKPQNFPNLWIVNSNSKSIRQYRILIKIETNDIPFTSGTLTLFKQPKIYYKNIMINKNSSFCNNNSEKVIYLYTTNDYTYINEYLRTGQSNYNKYSENQLMSWVWCLHSALRNFKGDKSKIGLVDDNTIVYRGCTVGFDKNKYQVGSQFYFGEFISTSKSKEIAINFGGSQNLMIITITNNKKKNYCYYVKNISAYQTEEEIIITAFCNFLITKYEYSSGINIIYLVCLGYVLDENKANEWPSIN